MNTSSRLAKEVTLLDLLDRVLDKGLVLTRDNNSSTPEMDLVHGSLKALLSSVETVRRLQVGAQIEETQIS